MAELVLLLLALLALGSPSISLVFALAAIGMSAWKQYRLRQQLVKLTDLNIQQNDALRRELLELRRQIAPKTEAAEQPVEVRQRVPAAAPPQPTEKPLAPSVFPGREPVRPEPGIERTPELFPETKKEETLPVAAPRLPIAPASPATEKPVTTVTPTGPKPVLPTAVPSKPPTPPVVTPLPPVTPKPVPAPAFIQPREPAPAAARVNAPQSLAPLRVPTSRPSMRQRMKSVATLEETLGTNWLNKLGIIILVLGVALFGIYELGELGPAGKAGLSYLASLALLGGGIFLEKRERYRVLGRTGIGGGWALLFFTTYAINHVQAMRVVDSETADLILMLAVAVAMVAHTLRYNSQLVTGLAFLLAYTTVALSHDNVYSLSAGVILAIGLVSIVVKRSWFELEVLGILSSYLNHLYWLYRILGPDGAQGHSFPEYHASMGMLFFYWLTFRISYVVRKIRSPFEEHVSTVAALLNTLLLLGVLKFQSVRPELAFLALLVIGAIEFTFGQLPVTKRRREAFVILTVVGAALMIAAVPSHYSGNNVAILWLVGAEAFLAVGVVLSEVVFRRLGLLTGLLVAAHLVGIDFIQLINLRRSSGDSAVALGVLFALCAGVFYLNALMVGRHWKSFFSDSPDAQLLATYSYVGGFAGTAAAWALCSHDWTALAFTGVMLVLAGLGRRLESIHLQVQYGLIGALAIYRVFVVNLHSEIPAPTHVRMRLLTLPILAAAFYLTAKWAELRDDANQRGFRGLFAAAGTALLTLLIYYEVPELWQPLAAIAFAVLLAEIGRLVRYPVLAWHTHLLAVLAAVAAVTADLTGVQRWNSIPVHTFGALPVVAGAYWLAKRISVLNPAHLRSGRALYSWVGTGLMVWVLEEALHAPWIAVGWIAFAVLLALSARWLRYHQFAWQASAVAACAFVRIVTYDFTLEQKLGQGVSIRLVTVSLVAAGLYFVSRRATAPDSIYARAFAFLHTSGATALLAILAWYEAPGGWLAAVWAVFAVVLAAADRRFNRDELQWQAHALAGLSLLRGVTVTIYVVEYWHGISVRLLSLAIVAVALYTLARLIRMPEQWHARDFHHVYSWAASALVSLLMWYELQPLSVAVGWAVFGLVLFEYGLLRKIKQFRFQAYVALAAAFGRIFFANLLAGPTGEFWGPRLYTVLPLAVIMFFIYAQLGPAEESAAADRGLHFDTLLAYLGTGCVVAVLYFQFAGDWIVTAWSLVMFVLLGAALVLDRPIFLHQGLLLAAGSFARGVAHNLFGESYFSGGTWTGRYFVLGSAVAIMLASLPFVFRLRSRYDAGSQRPSRETAITRVVRRPEQVMFFLPVALLTLMLALKMRAGMVTVSWGIEGVLIVLLALLVNVRSYRLTGLALLLLCVGKVMAMDAWGLAPRDRYITFIIVGAALLLVSFLYSKYRDTIRQFL